MPDLTTIADGYVPHIAAPPGGVRRSASPVHVIVPMLDDCEALPGAKKATEEYLTEEYPARHRRSDRIRRFRFAQTPCPPIEE